MARNPTRNHWVLGLSNKHINELLQDSMHQQYLRFKCCYHGGIYVEFQGRIFLPWICKGWIPGALAVDETEMSMFHFLISWQVASIIFPQDKHPMPINIPFRKEKNWRSASRYTLTYQPKIAHWHKQKASLWTKPGADLTINHLTTYQLLSKASHLDDPSFLLGQEQ